MSSTRTWGAVNIHHYWTGNYTQQHIITNATFRLDSCSADPIRLGTSDFNIPECNNRDAVLLHCQADSVQICLLLFIFLFRKDFRSPCLVVWVHMSISDRKPFYPARTASLAWRKHSIDLSGLFRIDGIGMNAILLIFFNLHRLKWWYSVMKWGCNRTFSNHGSFSSHIMHHKGLIWRHWSLAVLQTWCLYPHNNW